MCILLAHLPSGRVKNRCRGRGRPSGNFLVGLEPWGLHGVFLSLYHSNDPLLGSRVVSHTLLCWGVSNGVGVQTDYYNTTVVHWILYLMY